MRIITALLCIACNLSAMQKNTTQQTQKKPPLPAQFLALFQPCAKIVPSLTALAARVVAAKFDPKTNYAQALEHFNSPLVHSSDFAPGIRTGLAHRATERLEKIVQHQTPQELVFGTQNDADTLLPEQKGIFIKRKLLDGDYEDCLYERPGLLYPDPLTAEKKNLYAWAFGNNDNSLYFVENKKNPLPICATTTGMTIYDQKKVYEELKKLDSFKGEDDIWVEGISANNNVAWTRFLKGAELGVCAFSLNPYKLLLLRNNAYLATDISHNHEFVIIQKNVIPKRNKLFEIYAANTADLIDTFNTPADYTLQDISPTNEFCILSMNGICEICYDFKTQKLTNYTRTQNSPDSISPNGRFLARESYESEPNCMIEIRDLHNDTSWKITIPGNGNDVVTSLFSPDNKTLFLHKANDEEEAHILYTYTIEHKEMVHEQKIPFSSENSSTLIFCNDNKYLMLPYNKLLILPEGLVAHLTCKELMALLLVDYKLSQKKEPSAAALESLQKIENPTIKALIDAYLAHQNKNNETKPIPPLPGP